MNGKENRVKTAVIVTTAILVLMSMLPAMVSAQSDVKINEIMYNPSTEQGSDANMEWIELYNKDTEAVNISGWTVDNNPISDNVMQPGDYVVLARNKTAFDAYYGALPCSVIDVTFVLANTGDTIVLENRTGAEVDNVTYNSSWGADENGKTLERNVAGWWENSLADGGTPCELNSVKFVIPFSSWGPPVIYTSNITVDTMNPENVGKNTTTGLFTATEMIDNESYYVVRISKPLGTTKVYISMDGENEDYLVKREVTAISNLTFDPAFVMWDFPLMAEKTWTSTSNVTGDIINETGSEIPINSTAVVSGEVTAEVVAVPFGTFPCLVIENNISYEVEGIPISNSEKYWISPMDNGYLTPKYQSCINGELVEEQELIEVIPPTYLNATDNNTTINATTGEFLVITLEGNPTTGYIWEVTEPLDERIAAAATDSWVESNVKGVGHVTSEYEVDTEYLVLQQVGDIAFVQDYAEPGLVGVPGVQIATFEVVGAGDATINMVYHQPWLTDVEPVDTFTLNVIAS
jgi:predicted secreted protein